MRKKVVFACFAFSGTAALTYEVVWTRAFSIVVGSTTHALSTVLGAFMAGLALGAFLGGRKVFKGDPVRMLGAIEFAIAITGLLTLTLIHYLPPLYARLYYGAHEQPALFYALQFVIVFAVLLLPTTLMGMTFPTAVRAWTRSLDTAGTDSGALYSVNTLGAVLGSVVSGFVLIPQLGLHGANLTAAALNLLAGLLLGGFALRKIGVALVIFGSGLWLNSVEAAPYYPFNFYNAGRIGSYEEYQRQLDSFDVVWDREDHEGHVQVTKSRAGPYYALTIRGKPEGALPAGDQPNQLLMAYLGAAYRPDAKTFLKIGLGPGVTLAAAAGIPELARLDVIEINPSVPAAVSENFFPGLLSDPRIHVIEADARNHLMVTQDKYDIISSQSSDPTDAGSGNLFTKEYFEIVKARLNENGVFVEHVPSGLLGQEATESFIKTLATVFPYVYEWDIRRGSHNVLAVAALRPQTDSTTVKARIAALNPHVADAIAFGAAPERVRKLLTMTRVPVATDDRPALEFTATAMLLRQSTR